MLEIYSILTTLIIIFLLFKIYRMFTIIVKFEQFFIDLKGRSERALSKLKYIDSTGHFESDDEVGWTFDHIKNIILDIDNFFVEQFQEEREETQTESSNEENKEK